MDVEKLLIVVDHEIASEFAFTQEVVECDPRPNRNTRPELLPPSAPIVQSDGELLRQVSKSLHKCINTNLHYASS
jgi:hypothetical protein